MRFNTSHVHSQWDASSNTWSVTLKSTSPDAKEYTVSHPVFISSIGGFSKPLTPPIAGIDKFKGDTFHCATWPEGLGLEQLHGKTVGVVGNACSG